MFPGGAPPRRLRRRGGLWCGRRLCRLLAKAGTGRTRSRCLFWERVSMGKKVTVVGAGFYGSTTAQRLAEYDVFETVMLTDIIEGRPAGIALDLNQSRPI